MAGAPEDRGRSRVAVLKVLYLLAVTAVVFVVPAAEGTRGLRWYVVPGLLAAQVLTLLVCGVRPSEIFRPVWRLKWFFAFLILCYALLPAEDHLSGDAVSSWRLPGTHWTVPLNVRGMAQAGLMCLQILTVVLASAVVRLTGSGSDLVDGLRAFGLPRLFVHSFDRTLGLLGGLRRRDADEGGRAGSGVPSAPAPSSGLFAVLGRLLRGDIGPFVQSIRDALDRARAQAEGDAEGRLDRRLAHDVAVITGVALVMVSFKMVKLLPGVPFAPGFKVVLFFPLYVLAAHLTHSRWGGTAAGAIMGVIGFLQGDGRYGVLEVLKHLAPGLVIDLAMPVVRRLPPSALVFCLLGFVAAAARTSTEWVVVLLLGARAEVYLFPAAQLVPTLIAGTLSGFVTAFVLRAASRQDFSPEAATRQEPVRPPEGEAIESAPTKPGAPDVVRRTGGTV